MSILDLVRLIRHHAWLLVGATVAGVLVAALFSALQPTLYAASARGYVTAGASDSVGQASAADTLAGRKALAYEPLVNGQSVREGIAEELRGSYPQGVRVSSLTADAIEGSNLLVIRATAPSPQEARDVANAAMRATAAEALRLDSMGADGVSTGQSVVRLVPSEDAALPGRPVSPDWPRNLILGAIAGFLGGLGAAFILRSIDGRMRTQDDVEQVTGGSVLGIIPKADELAGEKGVSQVADSGPVAESLRQLRTNLRFVSVDNPPRSIVITSPNPSEGKSTVAANLAKVLAQSGQPVVLVDADLRRPTQAQRFGLDNAVGLTQVLAGDLAVDEVLQPTGIDGLTLLSSGRIPPNPSELVGSQRMRTVIDQLAEAHTVLIDAPPMLPVTDGGLLTAASDGAILVLKVGVTQKEQARQASKLFARVNGVLLGSVLNQTPKRSMGTAMYGYGYGGYNTDYASRREPRREAGRRRERSQEARRSK